MSHLVKTALTTAALASSAAFAQLPQSDAALRMLLDRMEITDVTNRVGVAADLNDFKTLRTAFADEVDVDYTSLFGGQPARVKADDLMLSWQGTLPGFASTQHSLSNHTITLNGERASAIVYVTATHRLDAVGAQNTWTVGGYYEYALSRTAQGWKVNRMKLNALWGEGNIGLVAQATERVKNGQGRK